MRDSIRTKNCRYKKPFTITSDSKIYKNQKINLDKMQKLGDGITFVLNCDFVCDIVNAEEMKTFPKKYLGVLNSHVWKRARSFLSILLSSNRMYDRLLRRDRRVSIYSKY